MFFIAWEFTADDAYISFRYAQNFADGNGMVWNQNSTNPVEGFTNFLWTILMVVPHIFGASPVLFSKLVGMFFWITSSVTLYLYVFYKTKSKFFGLLALLLLMILPSTYFHTVSGLETVFFAFLMLLLFILGYETITREDNISTKILSIAPILVLLAGMTRPDGLIPGLFVLVIIYLFLSGKARRQFLLSIIFFLIIPGGIYFLGRYLYFGWLFPNSFYIKFGNLARGMAWLLDTIGTLAGALTIILLFLPSSKRKSQIKIGTKSYFILFVCFGILAYPMSNLTMNYMGRFIFHFMPVIILSLIFSLCALSKKRDMADSRGNGQKALMIIFFAMFCIFPQFHNDELEMPRLGLYESHLAYSHLALATALNEADIPEEDKTLALGDAGIIPYYSEWFTYDYVGLNNEFIAHNKSQRTEYINNAQPTVLILYSYNGLYPRPFQYNLDVPSIIDKYQKVGYIKMFPNYFLGVYVNKNVAPEVMLELVTKINEVRIIAEGKNNSPDNRSGLLAHVKTRLGIF